MVLEVFRTRQESLLASFIIRILRKGGDTFEVPGLLKHLHDSEKVTTKGPQDLTLWSYRAQLLQYIADSVSRDINDIIGPTSSNAICSKRCRSYFPQAAYLH